jgi:hypothetical protein
LVAGVSLLVLLGGGWVWWDIHRTRSFCNEIKPGMLLSSLPQMADTYGVSRRLLKGGGIRDKTSGIWILPVPATLSVGDVVCVIQHDNATVLSARMEEH